MDEAAFRALAHDELESLERALDAVSALTVDLASDILTVEFDDGEKFILNVQGPTQQLWFAARYAAGHFTFDEAERRWKDSRSGEELRARVSRDVSEKLGLTVSL